jgi:hypothetical protein
MRNLPEGKLQRQASDEKIARQPDGFIKFPRYSAKTLFLLLLCALQPSKEGVLWA